MSTAHSRLLDRFAPERNMARFYEMSVEPTLFGEVALVRRWGRIGTLGRRRIDIHPHAAAALAALEEMTRAKLKRGYRPRS